MTHRNVIYAWVWGLMILVGCSASSPSPFIAVDQVGYRTFGPKEAYHVHGESDRYELIQAGSSTAIRTLTSDEIREPDLATGDRVRVIEFGSFVTPGEYRIRSVGPDPVLSEPFVIAADPYRAILPTLIKSYYYHRCGSRVSGTTEWTYEACHLDDAEGYDQRSISHEVTGGWHDAGDYNKFSVNTALSAALLLYAHEFHPGISTDQTPEIPESGNGRPNLLDETEYALKWLLKMQDADGSVYHKVSQEKWIGEFMPDQDPATRYLFEPSSAATASFTAVTALASRILQPSNPGLSEELQRASLNAWSWLQAHPENVPNGGFSNPQGVTGGEYGDVSDRDERLWAAAELYRLTGDSTYAGVVTDAYDSLTGRNTPPLSWRNVHTLAIHATLSWPGDSHTDSLHANLSVHLVDRAEAILRRQKENNYRTLLRPDEYYWGSNSVGLGYALDLLLAHRETRQRIYLHGAIDQIHYLLGRNPFNQSQVTGVGSRPVRAPYHQLSETGNFSEPIPGMLVGGPNAAIHLNDRPISPYPGKNYEDRFENYLVNEPAINFTAILITVLAMVSPEANPFNHNPVIGEAPHP